MTGTMAERRAADERTRAHILELYAANPKTLYREIAKAAKCSEAYVSSVLRKAGINRHKGKPQEKPVRGPNWPWK